MRFEADSPERMESLRAQAERLARQWMEECAGEQAGFRNGMPRRSETLLPGVLYGHRQNFPKN